MLKPWIASTLVVAGLALLLAPGALADVTEFPLPHAESRPYTIVPGPDGNLWFTESGRGTDRSHHAEWDDHRVSARVAGQPAVRDHGRR